MRASLKTVLLNIWEVAEIVLISLATVFFIRSFIAQPFLVSGASMEPTFSNGNYLIIDEVTYRFREPERGEVVVFKYPGDERSFFIKRIIGLPGETVKIRNSVITIIGTDGETTTVIDEPYITETTKTLGDRITTLEAGEYFVLGDNRGNSFDSRNWGPLDRDHIIGIARLRVYPFADFNVFETPIYQQ